ncbi:MAG TPA: hypothetical protein DIT04_01690 [Dysgonomonas sp.]|nr:hypothetical protein [Dysgonomonas sp.]
MPIKYFYLVLLFLVSSAGFQNMKAQTVQLSDSSQISLLTNTPWDGAVYSLFGHTALRVQDSANNLDIAFNYGLFDFDSPNFIYRFAKGETDYAVGYDSTDRYIFAYKMRGIGITEQVLNLTQEEKQNLFEALLINSLPENRVYRYNYFYDNCSTRPRDMVENNIEGTISYNPTNKQQTYRDLVHECVNSEPWVKFGIDLVIGADADKVITDRQKDFLPAYLMNAYSGAKIKNTDGTERNLLQSEDVIFQQADKTSIDSSVNQPLIFGIILLLIACLVSFFSVKGKIKTLSKLFDFLLFFSAGIAGCVIFFLMYFSVHPCTNPNWNIVWLNPLQLIIAFLLLIKFFSKVVYWYHFINFALLIVFLLAWFLIPQQLETAFIPYILALIARSGTNVISYKRNQNKRIVQSAARIR